MSGTNRLILSSIQKSNASNSVLVSALSNANVDATKKEPAKKPTKKK